MLNSILIHARTQRMELNRKKWKVQTKIENALESGVLTFPRTDTFLPVWIVAMLPFSSKLGNKLRALDAQIV